MDIQKLLKIVAIVIGVISIFFLGSIISTGDEAIKAGESSGSIDTFMYVAYAIFAIAIVACFRTILIVSKISIPKIPNSSNRI